MATKKDSVEKTMSIGLNIPVETYFSIKHKADRDTISTGNKKTIHDKIVEILVKNEAKTKKQL